VINTTGLLNNLYDTIDNYNITQEELIEQINENYIHNYVKIPDLIDRIYKLLLITFSFCKR